MPKKPKKKKPINFTQAIQTFIGYLKGTQKSEHTIKSYSLDLAAFQDFIGEEYEDRVFLPSEISPQDLMRYRQFLQKKGFKTNTRRRKLLTVSQFLQFLAKRKKLPPDLAKKVPAPHKIERIPFVIPSIEFLKVIQGLPNSSPIEARNQILLWTLAETGCLVSEVVQLKFDQWVLSSSEKSGFLEIFGKSPRKIPISLELFQAVRRLQTTHGKSAWIFQGFNKFGAFEGPISARGVELLVKSYGKTLGHPTLTPRTFRHSIIIHWLKEGLSQNEVQERLGLRTAYAFRSYEALLRKKNEEPKTD